MRFRLPSRRGFLSAPAVALALSQARGSAAAADDGAVQPAFKLGVATYSLRKFSRAEAIRMLRELNVKYVNIKDVHLPLNSPPADIAAARKEFEDAGLTILGGGNVSFQKDDPEDMRRKFEYARLAGMPLLVCAPTHATLPKLEKLVEQYDIKIAVHNHGPEDKNFPTPQSALEAVKNMDPRCGLCIDVGHTARAGVDVVDSIRQAGARLLDLHAKDLRDLRARDSQCDVGDGQMPIAGIFEQLAKMKYAGGVMLEYEINEDRPLDGMRASLAYMRGVLAGLRAGRSSTAAAR